MHEDMIEGILDGDRRMMARAISLIENGDPSIHKLLSQLYPHTGNAFVIGITGAPGAGKSTLMDQMLKTLRRFKLTVGVISVDPTSPYTGGAVLGDRIRMQEHASDKGIFIRSMGTRGSLGGLSIATKDTVQVMDASGKDVILIETVGVGQSEVDIIKFADTTIVVLNPSGGDIVQTIKAGIMEIADIFVVNKADLDGAERTCSEINMMLELGDARKWRPPIIRTISIDGTGISEMYEAIVKHRSFLNSSGNLERLRKERISRELADLIEYKIKRIIWNQISNNGKFDEVVQQIMFREADPYTAASQILDSIKFEYSEIF